MNKHYVIVRLQWVHEIKFHPVFDVVPLKELIAFLISTPSFYPLDLKLDLAFIDLEDLYAVCHKEDLSELLQALLNEIYNSIDSCGIDNEKCIFHGWLDSDSIILSDTKKTYEWL